MEKRKITDIGNINRIINDYERNYNKKCAAIQCSLHTIELIEKQTTINFIPLDDIEKFNDIGILGTYNPIKIIQNDEIENGYIALE